MANVPPLASSSSLQNTLGESKYGKQKKSTAPYLLMSAQERMLPTMA